MRKINDLIWVVDPGLFYIRPPRLYRIIEEDCLHCQKTVTCVGINPENGDENFASYEKLNLDTVKCFTTSAEAQQCYVDLKTKQLHTEICEAVACIQDLYQYGDLDEQVKKIHEMIDKQLGYVK